ncbi:MAG: glycosyltransferase family 4 protein [bacterium]|nr:glycosyltransferase family 4 protein [bacterium]
MTHNLKQDNGAGVFSHRLIVGLKDMFGVDVVALTTEKSGESYELPLLNKNFFRNFFALRRIIKDCDVVHALDAYPYGVMATLLLVGLRKKFIITAIGTGAFLHLYKPLYASLLRYAYRKADRVTAVSNFSKDEIIKKVQGLSVRVITHGVDYKEWEAAQGSAAIQTRIRSMRPYIISVGAMRTRKGYNLSIRSFAKIKKQFPDLQYVIVAKKYGDSFYYKIRALIKNLALEESVHILEDIDTREDLAELYRRAECFCLLSRSIDHDVEAFGLVFLEAAACGLPIIGTTDGGVPDAARSGENAILIDIQDTAPFYSENEDPMSKAVAHVLGDQAYAEKMKHASLTFARASDWAGKMAEYGALYKTLI